MTHDPLCPEPKCDYGSLNEGACYGYGGCTHWCQCDLITKVRADERQRIIGVMERNADGDAIKVIDAVLDML